MRTAGGNRPYLAEVDERLGPEPFGLRAAALAKRLEGRRRPIKSALLDQSICTGGFFWDVFRFVVFFAASCLAISGRSVTRKRWPMR